MKVLVFGGSGKMGAAAAWDLVRQDDVEIVGLVGRTGETLKHIQHWIQNPKVTTHILDVSDIDQAKQLMRGYDVGVIALPDRQSSYMIAQTAIETGLHIVDMLEEYHRRPDPYETEGLRVPKGMTLSEYGDWLHALAVDNNVTFLDGIGFAPGISNITVGEGIRKLDQAVSAIARVGGIPSKDSASRHPLKYMITWAFDHVLREYAVKLDVIKDGKIVEVDASTDLERFRFNQFGVDEILECAITPGMPSFIYTRPDLQEFAEKTVRWPGHWQGVEALREIGMLDLEPVEVNGVSTRPRDVLLAVIEPKLKPLEGDTDVCVMWNTVDGMRDGQKTRINYYMWDEADRDTGISSMARVTGFSAVIGALLVGRRIITETGIVPPEDCIEGEIYSMFIEELAKRNINILEVIEAQNGS